MANIFSQYLQPQKSVSEYGAEMDQADLRRLQLEGQQGQNQLLNVTRQQQMQAAQQQMSERNALQRLAQQHGGDEESFERALMSSGMPGLMAQAEAISKRRLDRKKTDSEIKERDAKTEKEKHALGEAKRKEALQHIGAFRTPDEAMASLQGAADIPPEQKQAILQSLQATGGDPLKFREWQLRLVLSLANPEQQAKGMAPNVQTRNTGATTDTLAVDPLTGVGRVTGSVQNTQSPDSVASNATTRRGQDLTDARGKEANAIQKQLVIQEKQLKVDELNDKKDQRQRGRDAAIASVSDQIRVIDKALTHPGRETSTGLSGTIDPRNYVPGTDATDFQAVLDQIGGTAFLQAFESLKGGGQITEMEGKKASDAIARLRRAQSDGEFKKSLEDLRQVMQAGYKRLTGKDYGGKSASGDVAPSNVVDFNDLK
jgi:hypothetical protein